MDQNYVVHNAVEVTGFDTWLVIDRVSGTAVIQRKTEEEAREDARIANGFYDRWPGVEPIKDVSFTPGGVNEDGSFTTHLSPLLSPGFWAGHDWS